MAQGLCEGGLGFVGLVGFAGTVSVVELHHGPQQATAAGGRQWLRPSCSRVLTASVVCAVEVSGCGSPVQDATSAPPARRDCYKLAPRTLALKTRRARRRGSGGRNDEEGDDGGIYDGGSGFGGDGSWGGGENGRGGWDSWGESWNDESSRRWSEGRDALALLYQAACWISLSKCVHYVFVKAVGWGRESVSATANDGAPFAQCSSVFMRKEPVFVPAVVEKIMC